MRWFCDEVLANDEVEVALRRNQGILVLELPQRLSDRDLVDEDFVLLMRLSSEVADSNDCLKRVLIERLGAFDDAITSRLVKPSRGPTPSIQTLCSMIPEGWYIEKALWEIQSDGESRRVAVMDLAADVRSYCRKNDLRQDVSKLREVVESMGDFSCLTARKTEGEVVLAFKLENIVYVGSARSGALPSRTPKRILALDGTLLYEVDENEVRRKFEESIAF